MINNFSIFKVTEKKNEKSPDYTISTNVGTKEAPEYVNIGVGWMKAYTGGKFISCKLSEPFEARNGYHIEVDLAEKQPVVPNFDRDSQGNEIKTNGTAVEKEIRPEDIDF